MEKLIVNYKKKLKKFDLEYNLSHKHYEQAAAIAALETAAMVPEAYFKEIDNLTHEDNVLRLYALLQSLFVSIDSLYSLSYAITGSKNFININSNPQLRKLKYIRNNVVGHPSNRVIGYEKNRAYCILDNSSVTKESFSYNIYSYDEGKELNKVDVSDLVSSYYKESNNLLDSLYKLSGEYSKSSVLKESIKEVLDKYYRSGHFREELYRFIDRYKETYGDPKREQHRVIWRYELVLKLMDVSNDNIEIMEVVKYCIGIELNKMYKMLWGKDYTHRDDFKLPSMVLSVYRFFNRNREFVPFITYLKDSDDPLFFRSLKAVYEGASVKKMQQAMDYLGFLITLYYGQQWDLVYAISLPIAEYKTK